MENHQTINLSRDRHDHYEKRIDVYYHGQDILEKGIDFSRDFKPHSYTYDEGMEVSYMSNLNDKMSDVLIDTDTLKNETNVIKTDITVIKNDVSTIKTDVNNLTTSFDTSVKSISTNIDSIDNNVSGILDEKLQANTNVLESFKTEVKDEVVKFRYHTLLSAGAIIVTILAAGWFF